MSKQSYAFSTVRTAVARAIGALVKTGTVKVAGGEG